jgi:surfactin synthase thioesterase subunit
VSIQHLPRSELRLFCLPYAGGSAVVFRPWREALPAHVTLHPLELPGHGTRLREPAHNRIADIVAALAVDVMPYLDRPFAFFGHSLGALVAFELCRYLRQHCDRRPQRLFISACPAPTHSRTRPALHGLPDDQLVAELHRLGGTPTRVLDSAELMELLLPAVRADFAALETYEYIAGAPLTAPMLVFGGKEDTEVPPPQLQDWRGETTGPWALQLFPGGHFFLHSAREALLQAVREALSQRS